MTETQPPSQMHWLAEVPIMVVEMVLLWWTMLPVLGDIGWSLNWQTVLSIPTLLTAHTARMLESTVILNVRDKYYLIYCQQYTTLYTVNSILYYMLSTVYYINHCNSLILTLSLVACQPGSVRLSYSTVPLQGTLGICSNETWHTLCDRCWDNNDAAVVCHQLGYSRIGTQTKINTWLLPLF